jgi:polyhydroxybutyrate depolymerase
MPPVFCYTAAMKRAMASVAVGLAAGSAFGQTLIQVDAGRGPVDVLVPTDYTPERAWPLVVLLHGYTSSGAEIEAYMRLGDVVDELGFLLALPDGTEDVLGLRFWNATDACCDHFGRQPDDVGYLTALLDAVGAAARIDGRRVFFAGHSNGGFMSYRMACELPARVAAIASMAGATYNDPARCTPIENVHTLQIHGTNDTVIRYGGGSISARPYPGAVKTTETWAMYNGCSLTPDLSAPPLDLDSSIPGAETRVARYAMECDPGGSAELWTIEGGAHSPPLTTQFPRLVAQWLLDHAHACYADCDGSGELDFFDFLCFQEQFARGAPEADCDGSGSLDFFDFLCFQEEFAAGCE